MHARGRISQLATGAGPPLIQLTPRWQLDQPSRNPRNLTYKIAHGCSAAPLVRHASVAPPMFPWAFLILIAAQVSATPNVRRVEGRLQLRKILEASSTLARPLGLRSLLRIGRET